MTGSSYRYSESALPMSPRKGNFCFSSVLGFATTPCSFSEQKKASPQSRFSSCCYEYEELGIGFFGRDNPAVQPMLPPDVSALVLFSPAI